jgi:hypothetical protein
MYLMNLLSLGDEAFCPYQPAQESQLCQLVRAEEVVILAVATAYGLHGSGFRIREHDPFCGRRVDLYVSCVHDLLPVVIC